MNSSPTLADIEALVSPRAGLVSHAGRLESATLTDWFVAGAGLGDLSAVSEEAATHDPVPEPGTMNGAGTDRDQRRASWLATAESLERYATCLWHDLPMHWATQRELEAEGEATLDLGSLASVSEAEEADPLCRLRRPSPDEPVRWVRGVDLRSGRPAWVPAILVYFYIVPQMDSERIWLPISTGCAVHTDPRRALLGGLLEVVEREAIATTWLRRLSLPHIDTGGLDAPTRDFLREMAESGTRVTLLDATTDLGAPTVYCLSERPGRRRSQLVTCATSTDPVDAALKAVRESESTWIAIEEGQEAPDDPRTFHDVMHGAVHMADASRAHAFDFLRQERLPRRRPEDMARLPQDPGEALNVLYGRLAEAGQDVFAVDLTTDEAARVGMHAVRVLVPGLVPLSFSPAAQFTGTPRLRRPSWARSAAPSEEELNPWPQPFA
ncbi:hypothetical protein GCM10007147_41700 [Nocardiopsis kunsanensis]|uniref:YcaO domain-containing protein n=1 Tax=Nocardiopsis kunsanensis TaxID=141693 RepID=A0A918XKL2_9ACTN|nr:YcaO-like family protein [Nocardiopsis kunsanensis]GHD35323.1 hypothetical protein GCM10007147_41700 [Nocardiopsis kunsanensis]